MFPQNNKAYISQACLQGIIGDAENFGEGALKTRDQDPPT